MVGMVPGYKQATPTAYGVWAQLFLQPEKLVSGTGGNDDPI